MNLSNLLTKIVSFFAGLLVKIVNKVLEYVSQRLEILAVFYRLFVTTFTTSAGIHLIFRETLRQIYLTSIQGAHLFILVSLVVGMMVIVHSTQYLVKLQGDAYVGQLLVTIVVREVGPVLGALFVLLRSGTTITAEIGTMSVTHEVDALKMLGIDPYRYLGLPRFWGLTIGLTALFIVSIFTSVLGGFLFAQIFADIYWDTFWLSFLNALQWMDLVTGFTKVSLFGMFIATVSIYFGLKAHHDLTYIGFYTSKATVMSLLLCGTVDVILTSFYYF
jgi:phospholipid/cholesterol/gamma-HCH transport system permease protein